MEHLLVDPAHPDLEVVGRAARIVRGGGIVAYPTDTLYGLAVDPRRADAVQRLFGIKGRGADQAIPLIASDVLQVERDAGHMTALACRLAARFWPGPLTLLIPAAPSLVPAIHAGASTVAVRVPDHAVARALATLCETAVTSTSANVSGRSPSRDAGEVLETLGDLVDAVLDGGATPGGLPSTIVDVSGLRATLVRAGVVPWDRVLECLE